MRPRIIPVLLLDSGKRLVKTRRFSEEVYVGDPFNVIRIFNEKEVDEICVLDINASVEGRRPDVGFISELASECFMPLSYGGGIESTAVRALADSFGSQAVAVCIDCRRINNDWRVVFDRGRAVTNKDPVTQ